MAKEIRTSGAEVRASPDENTLRFEGYAARFDNWSEDLGGFREKIAPGAFKNAIQRDDVRALYNHNSNYVLGRNTSGTLRLYEDELGLRFEVDAPNASWARDLRESVKRGDVSQCSFSFETVSDEWSRSNGELDERTLKEVRLSDVSIVTYPAYEATSVSARCARRGKARLAIERERLDLKEKEWTK